MGKNFPFDELNYTYNWTLEGVCSPDNVHDVLRVCTEMYGEIVIEDTYLQRKIYFFENGVVLKFRALHYEKPLFSYV